MPFNPGRSGGNGYNNYSNPYAQQSTAPPKKSKMTVIVLSAIVGLIVVLGIVVGTYLLTMKKSQVNVNSSDGHSAVNTPTYVEVEIFDEETTEQ